MNLNPIENQPHGTFAEFANTVPVSARAVDTFKMALYHDGVQLGWLGKTACRFNRSMQHTRICASSGGVANEAEAEDLLF